MTVENTTNRKRFLGDGSTDEVTFTFRVLSASDLKIYAYPDDLVFDDLEDYLLTGGGVDYDVELEADGEGGTVFFEPGSIVAADEIGLILNELALTQTADLPTEGNFNETAVETALDRLVMQNIQQQEQIARGISLRKEDPLIVDAFTGFFIEAVEAEDRADRILTFNDTGDGVVGGILATDLSDLAVISDEIATVAAISAQVVTVAGIAANVTTVAGISASVSTVAGIAAAVSTVAGISANVTTVAGISVSVTTVAGISAAVSTVAAISAAVSTVAGISADVTTVAANIADVQNAEENANIAKAAAGFTYTYDSTVAAAADPGTGEFRLNHATLASATELYISETTGLAQAIAAELATWDDSTSTIHGKLRIFLQSDPSIFRIYNVTGTLTDNGGWDTLTIAHVTGNGAWSNADVMTVQYLRTGDKGDTGATGATGPTGPAGASDMNRRTWSTASDTAVVGDKGDSLVFTGSSDTTLAFSAAATLLDGWAAYISNDGTAGATITLDPNGAETIDGLANFKMYAGEKRLVYCNGSALFSIVLQGFYLPVTTTLTFTKPPGYGGFDVEGWGGGGGGGSGRRGAAGSARFGGNGGGGGAYNRRFIQASEVGTTETITIGAGGSIGAAQSSNDTNGVNGGNGGNSSFGSLIVFYGGGFGLGGTAATPAASGAGGGCLSAANGGTPGDPSPGADTHAAFGGATATGGSTNVTSGWGGAVGGPCPDTTNDGLAGSCSVAGGSGGGGGGAISTGNTQRTGGAGGSRTGITGGGGAGGAIAGGAGTTATALGFGGGGGGSHAAGVGGTGGNGGPGGGGGGGGASVNGSNSGAGGLGGRGEVRVRGVV